MGTIQLLLSFCRLIILNGNGWMGLSIHSFGSGLKKKQRGIKAGGKIARFGF